MLTFRSLTISIFSLILLTTQIDASRYRSVRQKRADACLNTNPDPCPFVICENSGQCIKDITVTDCFICQCTAGFTGKLCDTTIPILPVGCSPGCQNGGACNGNVCECPTGYTGTLCETRDNCLPSNSCQNGGRCLSNGAGYQCDCTGTGYTGTLCTDAIPTDPCASSPCQNGGQCTSNGVTPSCLCYNGYTGPYCQIAPVPCATTSCENGGECVLLSTNVYGCQCTAEFTGTRCETFILSTHPCVTMPETVCLNGAVCLMNGVDYLCKCATGWTGTNCAIQETAISCNPNPCLHGTCYPTNIPKGPTVICDCDVQWSGRFCDMDLTASCSVGYCLSGGVCQMNGNVPTCSCSPSYTGTRCELYIGAVTTTPITTSMPIISTVTNIVNPCYTNPCQNGGTCYENSDISRCECLPPWSGPTCTTLSVIITTTGYPTVAPGLMTCADQPCQNGGSCVTMGTSYSCFCGLNSVYTGKNCDTTTPMTGAECPLECAPGRCIFSGFPSKPYACLWNGIMRPVDGTTG